MSEVPLVCFRCGKTYKNSKIASMLFCSKCRIKLLIEAAKKDGVESVDIDIQTLFLCKPCAEEMKSYKTVKSVKYDRPAKDKGTCELCARRRFGYICEVEFREPEEIIQDE